MGKVQAENFNISTFGGKGSYGFSNRKGGMNMSTQSHSWLNLISVSNCKGVISPKEANVASLNILGHWSF